MKIDWKFEEHDIVSEKPTLCGDCTMVAEIIGQRDFRYHLLFLDNSSGWFGKDFIEGSYEKLGWSIEFFELFIIDKNELEI